MEETRVIDDLELETSQEQIVLKTMILFPAVIDECAMVLNRANFFNKAFGSLFQILVLRHQSGLPIDVIALVEISKQVFSGRQVAQMAEFLTDSKFELPHHAHIRYYCEKVLEGSKLRDLKCLVDRVKVDWSP